MTRREHAAILTGLRVLQNEMDRRGKEIETDPVWDVMTDAGELKPLTVEEISTLCERLNTSDDYKVEGT